MAGSDGARGMARSARALMGYATEERGAILAGIAFTLAATVLALIGPKVLEAVADAVSDYILGSSAELDMGWVAEASAILAAVYLGSLAFGLAQYRTIGTASERIAARMRVDLMGKARRLPLSYLESHPVGDTLSRVSNDTDAVRKGAADVFAASVGAAFTLVGSMAMMLVTCWQLALVSVVPTAAGLAVMAGVARATQRHFEAQQSDLADMSSVVEEAYGAHGAVMSCGGWGGFASRFEEANARLRRSSFMARVATIALPNSMNFFSTLGYVVVCVAGAYLILEGEATFGVVAAFIVYIKMFNQPLAQLADTVAKLQSVASASDRVLEFLGLPEEEDGEPLEGFGRAEGRVELRGVGFSYGGAEVLRGVDLSVEPGTTVAIVGPTGAGKSTIAGILTRLRDPTSGEVLIDGFPLSLMSRSQAREQFAVVPQDVWLFDGTLLENVSVAASGATRGEAVAACEAAGLGEYARSLPEGYDTRLEGSGVPAGRAQQIGIARALLRDAPMAILDEATGALDPRTEAEVRGAIDALTEGRTSFVIAHRLSTVRGADLIAVVSDGRVVESGTHEELVALGGVYRSLCDARLRGSG